MSELYSESEGAHNLLALAGMRDCPYRKCKHVYEEGAVLPTGLSYPTNVMVSGAWAFHMLDTHGIPVTIFSTIVSERVMFTNAEAGMLVDEATFDAHMHAQQERAREDARRKKVGITMGKGFDEPQTA
jgi:alanyl-tRNA synthetase